MKSRLKRVKSLMAVCLIGIAMFKLGPYFAASIGDIAVFSATLNLGNGKKNGNAENQTVAEVEGAKQTPVNVAEIMQSAEAPAATKASITEPAPETNASGAVLGVPVIARAPAEGEKKGDTLDKKYIGGGSSYVTYENVCVRNAAESYTVDIKSTLEQGANMSVQKGEKPYVLIYHTHTTESYLDGDYGWYPTSYTSRSLENEKNMVAVGSVIAEQLTAAGYGVIHVTEKFDYPSYSGAYQRSGEMIDAYLKKYPTIEVLLDIHRDAIQYDDGTKVKPTAVIDGKKAAQIMIISGCEEGSVEDFPNWRENLRFAVELQNASESTYPGLMRPLYFCARRYNMYKSHNSLLIEMGSDGNSIDEALYSGELFGKSLVTVLNAHSQ